MEDGGHDLLVENGGGGVGCTSTQRGAKHDAQGSGTGDATRRSERGEDEAWRGAGVGHRREAAWGAAGGAVSHDE